MALMRFKTQTTRFFLLYYFSNPCLGCHVTSSSDCPRSTKSIFDGFGIAVDAVIVAGIDFIGA
jgi:hypothetical protein